jgi:hypothetical protein
MAALVKGSRSSEKTEDEEERERLVEGLPHALRDPVHGEEPHVNGDEAHEHSGDDERQEQRLQDVGERAYDHRWDYGDAQLERKHRIDAFELRTRRVGVREDAERTESLLDEEGDVLGREENAQPRLDGIGERGVASAAVCCLRNRVEQARELDDLTVMPPDEVGRVLEARILVAADELDACGAPRTRRACSFSRTVGPRQKQGRPLGRPCVGRTQS